MKAPEGKLYINRESKIFGIDKVRKIIVDYEKRL